MGLRPLEFWELTFSEFWAIYDALFGEIEKEQFDRDEYEKLMRAWNGNA